MEHRNEITKLARTDTPKAKVASLRPLYAYVRPYWKSLTGVLAALVITSSAVLGLGRGLKHLVDEGLAHNNPALLDQALLVLLMVTVALAFATYCRFLLITSVGERVVADIRRDVFRHLIHLPVEFYERTKVGEIVSRITTDTSLLQVVVGSSLSIALRNLLLFIGGLALLVYTSPKLTVYITVVVPLVILVIILLGKQVRRLSRVSQDKVAELGAFAEESLYGIHTVQAFTREEQETERFGTQVQAALDVAMERVRRRAVLTATVILTVFGSIGFVLWIGGHDVLAGRLSGGELSSFIFYSIVVAGAVGAISEVMGDLQRAAGAAERLFELLETPSAIHDPAVPVSLPAVGQGVLKFDHVTFHYPSRPEKAALNDFSLTIQPGEKVALVGSSGSGKSTVFQLIMRFYDPQQGRITLDGVTICDLRLAELRRHFGVVSQDPVIFSATVLENIRYGNPNATDEEVYSAAQAAAAHDFISALPEGYHTFVGERGVRLSGGQKQRVAIARAILRDPQILLLDEATSALDTENEQLVQAALERLMVDRTTIIIAHRLSTVTNCDRIIVMDQGVIEEIGTHASLSQGSGLYARLAKKASL